MSKALAKTDDTRPPAVIERDIPLETWNAITTSVFPGAQEQSVIMAVDYCKARKMDILKKPVHIVPMQIPTGRKDANGYPEKEWRDIIMPGISEARTTAARTGSYAGQDEPKFSEIIDFLGVKAPESCTVTVYRMVQGMRVGFNHTEFFSEAVAIKKGWNGAKDKVNSMWTKRPRGQLAKCAEAGALRKAFPEELGNDYIAEEMHGKTLDMGRVEVVEEDEIPMPQATDAKPAEAAPASPEASKPAPDVIEGEVIPSETNGATVTTASPGAISMIRKQLERKNIGAEEVCKEFKVADLTKLTMAQVNLVFPWISQHA